MTARLASLSLAAGAVVLLAACSAPAAETAATPGPSVAPAATHPPEDTPTLVRTPPGVVPAATGTSEETPAAVPTPGPAQPTATHVPSPEDRDAGALRDRALAEIARGETAAALEDANAAVELAPMNLAVHDTRAYVRLVAGHHEEAYAEYRFILEQGTSPAVTLLGAGLAAAALADADAAHTLLTGGLKEAKADSDSPWDTDPQHRFLVTSASATLMALAGPKVAESISAGRLDEAVTLLGDIEAWAWSRDLAFVHEQKAAIAAGSGDHESAAIRLAKAIEIEPTARRYASLGQALFYSALYLDALRAYSTAIRLDPGNVQLYEDRAFINGKVGQWQRALEDLDHALQLAPDNSSLYAVRGEAHYQLGNPDAAILDFRRTLELQPAQADAALARERLAELAPGP